MSSVNTADSNPCFVEYTISMKCLDTNGYDQDKCEDQFENYRRCKKFWGYIQRQRRSQGIHPDLPPAEERKKIKAEFLNPMK